jgi:hypothetical protein
VSNKAKTVPPGTGNSKSGPAKNAGKNKKKGGGGRKGKKAKKKKKKEMKCGENGKYGDLKKKTGKGKFDRDHVPSKAALKSFARKECNGGAELCKLQKKAIENIGAAIAIPKGVHSQYSPTYGGNNTDARIKEDAGDLQAAAKRDTKDVSGGMKNPCKKKYDSWAKKVTKMTNADYKKVLKGAIKPFKPK